MEKHQIIRPRRITGTPYVKFVHKVYAFVSVASIIIIYGYNHWREDQQVYLIKSGYYNDEDLRKHCMRMSLLSLVSISKKTEADIRAEEELALQRMSERPHGVPEASIDY